MIKITDIEIGAADKLINELGGESCEGAEVEPITEKLYRTLILNPKVQIICDGLGIYDERTTPITFIFNSRTSILRKDTFYKIEIV